MRIGRSVLHGPEERLGLRIQLRPFGYHASFLLDGPLTDDSFILRAIAAIVADAFTRNLAHANATSKVSRWALSALFGSAAPRNPCAEEDVPGGAAARLLPTRIASANMADVRTGRVRSG